MPELPEVEVTRRGIGPVLQDARITAVRLGKPLRWPLGRDAGELVGAHIGTVARRGKYLWLPLSNEGRAATPLDPRAGRPRQGPGRESEGGLLLHLGMSGSLSLLLAPPPRGPHDHFEMQTTNGTLRLTDPRRFGAVVWSRALDADPAAALLAKLGAEPFDPALTPSAFHAALRRRRAPIKAVLLAGDVIVGAGNIYACEALFKAGIDPRARCDRISAPRAARLLGALRETLSRAVDLGGTTLRDFRDAHGVNGNYQGEALVYGRAGEPCPQCSAPIGRLVQAQRSTYFCRRCQKR